MSFKDLHPEALQPKEAKKNIVVIGDSMIKNVIRQDVSRREASTEDLIDHFKSAIRKNPDIVVIHTGINDLQKNNRNIVKKAKKLVSAAKEIDKDHSVKIAK